MARRFLLFPHAIRDVYDHVIDPNALAREALDRELIEVEEHDQRRTKGRLDHSSFTIQGSTRDSKSSP